MRWTWLLWEEASNCYVHNYYSNKLLPSYYIVCLCDYTPYRTGICTGHINNHSRLYPLLAISVSKMDRQALFESEPYGQMTKTSYLRMVSLVRHGWVLANDFLMSDAIPCQSHSQVIAIFGLAVAPILWLHAGHVCTSLWCTILGINNFSLRKIGMAVWLQVFIDYFQGK